VSDFDVIVIGGGPGGYVAAIRAAQLGKKTAVVEKDKAGGRCLNYACIPAKTILHSAEVYEHATGSEELGIKASKVTVDWDAVQARRAKVSEQLSGGVKMLWDKNKIEMIEGEGSLTAEGKVKVGSDEHSAKTIVLATGSVPMAIPGAEFGDRVLDTWGAWSLKEMPKKLIVVGAGASGAEIASGYGRFGVEVTLVEMLDQLLPAEDKDVAKIVERAFKKQNITTLLGTAIEDVSATKSGVKAKAGDQTLEADYLVIAGGRKPDFEGLGLEAAGIELEEDGKIKIDEFQKTSRDGVYAIGDIVRGPALAHKASEEGVVAVEHAAGVDTHPVDPNGVPGATFCHPQVASVGMTEAQAKEAGHDVKVSKFKLGAVGAGPVYEDTMGIVKIVGDPKYGEILGAHIVGNRACDMISEIVVARELEGGYPELARIIHPHPTISEAILDSARAVEGWATHA
jgi:dihydrolipoamide dehydrogenase